MSEASGVKTSAVKSAITGKIVYQLQESGQTEVHRLFEQARDVAQELRQTPIQQRQHAVEQVTDYIRDNREHIVDRICEETGKTRTDALVSEILGVLDNLEWNVHNAPKILKDEKVATPITLLGKKIPYLPRVLWRYPENCTVELSVPYRHDLFPWSLSGGQCRDPQTL